MWALSAEPQVVTVTVPERTKIEVKLDQEIGTANPPRRREVSFKVKERVTSLGVTILDEGDPGIGRIVKFKSPGRMGKPGEIAVRVDSVRAQDGEYLAVKGPRLEGRGESRERRACLLLPLFGIGYFTRGGDAFIPKDTTVVVVTKESHFFKKE